MGSNTILRWIILAIALLIALSIVNYVLRLIWHTAGTLIVIGLVVFVVWMIFNAVAKKKAY